MADHNNVELFEKSSWLKWQLVLAFSAPVALGFGYWYIIKKSKHDDPPPKNCVEDPIKILQPGNSKDTVTKAEINDNKSSSDVPEKNVPVKCETPLDRALALKASGNTFFKSSSYDDAIRCYTEAIEICPEEKQTLSECYQNRAAAYEQAKDYDKSIQDCSEAVKLNPRYLKALQRRAKAYEQTGKLQDSLEDVTAVCLLENFKNTSSLCMADRVLQQIGKESARKAMENQKTVLLSKHFVKSYFVSFTNDPILKNFNEWNGQADSGVENNPENDLDRAKRCLLKGEFEEIIPTCNKLLEADPKCWQALLIRATISFLYGEQKKALDDFNTIIDGDCADIAIKSNALIKRASLHLQLDSGELNFFDDKTVKMMKSEIIPEKCMKDFQEAKSIDPTNPDIYHHRGQIYLLMDQMEMALKDFKTALTHEPNMPIVQGQMYYAQYRIAIQSKDMGTIAKTFENFKELMKEHPNCIQSYTLYIQMCTEQQDFMQANEYFKKAIKVDPNNATIRVQRATLYLQWTGDINKAVELIEEAVKIDERCEYGYETLGTIEVQRGNLERAVVLFEKALPFAKSERELAHIYSLRDAAKTQAKVITRLGLPPVLNSS